MESKPRPPSSERLSSVIYDMAYRQIALFLAIWLCFAAPVSCDRHGDMSMLDMNQSAAADTLMPGMPGMGHGTQASDCAFQHHTSAPMSMDISFLPGIMPPACGVALSYLAGEIVSAPFPAYSPPTLSPEEQPPRCVRSTLPVL